MHLKSGAFSLDMSIEPNKNSKRLQLLQNFLLENKLSYRPVGKAYTNPNGIETSAIDYIFYDDKINDQLLSAIRLEAILTNVQCIRPYPLLLHISVQIQAVL